MKILFSPVGLILIVLILVVLFLPRRTPDAVKKRMGKPMRAFPQEDVRADEAATGAEDAPSAGSDSSSKDASGSS